MKHLRQFEKYTNTRKKEQIIKESVLQVNDIYKVRTFIDIPQSLINSYVKKVKDTAGKNLRQFFGDVDIAEEIVKYINTNYLNVDKIPAGALMGDAQAQVQNNDDTSTEVEPQAVAQTQNSTETEEPKSEETQEQPKVQVQAQSENFEEVSSDEGEEKPKEEETKEEVQSKEEETKEEGGSEELPG